MTEKQQYQKDKEWQQQMQQLKKIRNNTFKRKADIDARIAKEKEEFEEKMKKKQEGK